MPHRLLLVTLLLPALASAAEDTAPKPPPWHLIDIWWDIGQDTAFEPATGVAAIPAIGQGTRESNANPLTQPPTDRAVTRVKHWKQAVRHFGLHLDCNGDADNRYRHLTLSLKGGWLLPDHSYRQVKITKEQAERIIDHLAVDGFLDRAVKAEGFTRQAKRSYAMRAHVDDNGLAEDLGWGLPMLRRLDGLRKVLDGDAAKQMDWLLESFAEHRKEWEKQAKTSMKGWELYVWQQDGDTYFSLLPGTNRLKTDAEVTAAAVKGLDAIKPKLDELKAGEMVFPSGRRLSDRAPEGPAKEIRTYCQKLGLDVPR